MDRQGGRYINAGDLKLGDQLKLRDGSSAKVTNILLRQERLKTYNLHVLRLHNYAVGNAGVLVHNRSDGVCRWTPPEYEMHHTIPRQIQKRLPENVRKHPDVVGRKGLPNRKPVPYEKHRDIHRGPGGGVYNDRFDEEIVKEAGVYGNVTAQQIINIRDRLVKEFGL